MAAWMANVGRANCESQPPTLWLLLIPLSYAATAMMLSQVKQRRVMDDPSRTGGASA